MRGISVMSRKLNELRRKRLASASFREGYGARDGLIRLGGMLKQLRERARLTQEQLASRIGMTQPTISRLESGFGPRGPEMDTVARYVHGCDFELVVGATKRRSTRNAAPNADSVGLALQTMM